MDNKTIPFKDAEHATMLINSICKISVMLTMCPVQEKAAIFKQVKGDNPDLTIQIFNQAIEICEEQMVITAHNDEYCYQTNAILGGWFDKDKIWEQINELCP